MRAGLLLGLAVTALATWGPAPARADLRFREMPDSTELLQPLADPILGLPADWRLTTPPSSGYPAAGDPTVSVTIDPATGRVRESFRQGDVEIRDPVVTSSLEYSSLIAARTTRRLWRDALRTSRSVQRAAGPQRGLFRVELPVQFPKAVRSVIGEGAPNIEVSGSETITLAGNSDWVANQTIQTERRRQSAFPSFEMNQELNVNLTGSIGDKIKVDVDQSSNVQTSLDNKVKLRYEGDDDDMIKSVELGNTNLSLQGASIRQDGLFGVKSVAKLGNVDVTAIASKQEGKNETARFTPSGDLARVIIRDIDYIKRQYFLLADRPINIDYGTLEVYEDLGTGPTSDSLVGDGRLDPTRPAGPGNPQLPGVGNYTPQTAATDYVIQDDIWLVPDGKIPVLKLTQPLGQDQVLAIAYSTKAGGSTPAQTVGFGENRVREEDASVGKVAGRLLLKVIRPPEDDINPTTADGYYDPSGPWYPALAYELRNFYNLGASNISLETLNFKIRRIDNGKVTDPEAVNGKSFLQILGLDQKSPGGVNGADGQIDPQYLDADHGIVFFPDLTPFDPTGWPQGSCADSFRVFCLTDPIRNILRRGDEASDPLLQSNQLVYFRKSVSTSTDARYYIDAQFKSSRNGYYIGRFNILEGSEVVKVDGVPKKRDTDYRIDYTSGQITFVQPPGPEQTVTVDYSFAPGVGQVQRTLLGFSTSYNPAANLSFSSSMLYERRGAQEENVKLGEEPATSMIGDLSTVLSFRPVWMTQLADRVPGVSTSQPSALNIQANASTSIPNPNTKGEAYVDDMEGNRDSNTISLLRTQWLWASVPVNPFTGSERDTVVAQHSLVEWYLPKPGHVLEHDLKPVLRDEEGGKNEHQSLEINVLPPPNEAVMAPRDWTGITQSLGNAGQDFTKLQFVEIWVNDFRSDHTLTEGKLHLDFGRVSEDAYWDKNAPPNGRLDTEDKFPFNDQLDDGEDTGLDGVFDAQEPGYDPASNGDPNGDDYEYTTGSDDYSKINNTEKNGGDPNAKPDTEDLNHNGTIDTYNNYFETTLDLSDTNYVAIDVPKLYGDLPVVADNKYGNGWRLFRVPVDSTAFRRIGSGSWDNVQAVRLWVDSMTVPLRIQVGGIELVGNRWLKQPIDDSTLAARAVKFEVQNRNNKDDLGLYTPPYQPKDAAGSTAARREQSLALVYENMADGDSLFAFKTYGDPGTPLGWAQYRELLFYVHGDLGVEAQNLRAVARFGPDTVNYYEYSIPVRSGWQNVKVPMERLSGLKEGRAGRNMVVDRDTGAATGEIYTVVGNPSFTRINRVSFGLTVEGTPAATPRGEVWIDDLRLSDVLKDKGFASNVSVQANFADLMAMNVSYQTQNKDYFRVGQSANQGSGLDHTAIGFSSTLNVDRFMATSGVQLPVRFAVQHSTDVPRFRTGSDVVLDPARSEAETRRFDRQSVDLSYQRSGPRQGLTRYTLDALTTNMSYARQGSVNPQSTDSSWAFSSNVGYNVPIGGGGIRLNRNMKVNFLPETFHVGANWISTRSVSYSRTLTDTSDVQEIRSDAKQRQLALDMNLAYVPLSGIRTSYTVRSTRDMLLHQEGFFGANKGTEIRHEQGLDVNYRPRWLTILSPNIQLHGAYVEDASPDRRLLLTDPLDTKTISNSGTARTDFSIPLSRFGQRVRRPVADSAGVFPLFVPFRFLLAKMQDVSMGFDFSRGSSVSRVVGNPGFAFKSGFTQVFAGDLNRLANSTVQTSRRYSSRANTSFRPVQALNFDIRADHQLAFSDQVYGARRNYTISWPDIKARWTDVQRVFGLSSALSSLALSSSYQLKKDEQGPVGGLVEQRTLTTTLGPLLGWEASFKNGVRATVNSSYTKTETSDDRPTGVHRLRESTASLIQLNKVFPASKGIKLPWKKERVRLPNDLNLGVTVNTSADLQTLVTQSGREYPEQDNGSLNVTSNTNYNFSHSISGGFNLGFRQTVNRLQNITRRGITIALNATFQF